MCIITLVLYFSTSQIRKEEKTMIYKLEFCIKEGINKFSPLEVVSQAGQGGIFKAENISFAKREASTFIKAFCTENNYNIRNQKDWNINRKTNVLTKEYSLSVNGALKIFVFNLTVDNIKVN